jgi:RNA polymerase sigma factor (sigma-70 family)
MEVSALKYSGGIGLHGRSALLRLQSDERLVTLVRRGNTTAFEVLVSRYESRLLAFCRHLLGSREDAEDVLQEVLAAAFNALQGDDRPINVRPWLYRIARNRSLNHLRRARAVGVDSMDVHFSDYGASTADKAHDREEFRLLLGDINGLPETQKTALVLREMDALSYEQIAEAMETTVPSVKSLLVRARVSLAEAAEARLLSCEEVRLELGEVAEGLRRRPSPLVRRHLRACARCETFQSHLKQTNKALAALLPIGPLALLKQFALSHLGHSAAGGSGATAAGTGALSSTAALGSGATISSAGSVISAGVGTIAAKAAAGLAVTALVTAGAVEASHGSRTHPHHAAVASVHRSTLPFTAPVPPAPPQPNKHSHRTAPKVRAPKATKPPEHVKRATVDKAVPAATKTAKPAPKPALKPRPAATAPVPKPADPNNSDKPLPGRTQTQTDPTILTAATSTTPITTTSIPPIAAPAASPAPEPTTTVVTTTTTTSSASTTSTIGTTSTTTTPAPSGDPGAGDPGSGDPGQSADSGAPTTATP